MDSTGTRGKKMRRFWRLLAGGSICVMALTVRGSSGSGAKAPACDLTQLQLRDSTVNQGLGSYDRLVLREEKLLRLYFSLPSCAPSGAIIKITDGTLNATGGGA